MTTETHRSRGQQDTPVDDATLLVCISGPDAGKRVRVADSAILIGRGIDCHLVCEDSTTEIRHVAVLARDGRLAFEALEGSKVFLDGQVMERGKLKPGQQLRIGRSLWQIADEDIADRYTAWLLSAGGRLSSLAGIERVEGFSIRKLFSQVFKKHSQEEIEDYLNIGSPTTTPALSEVDSSWPTPWLFARAALLSVLVYLGFLFAVTQWGNLNFVPGLIFTGSFAIPISVLLFFFEVNVLRNVSTWQITKLFLVGAILSFGFTMVLSILTSKLTGNLRQYSAMAAGPIEESAKLLVMILFASQLRYKWILNGLLIGATVGCGFAAFESAGYAFTYGLDANSLEGMIGNITRITNLRGLLAISGMHIVWSGLIGAALWRVRGNSRFRLELLGNPRFLRVFAISVVLHSLWNSPWLHPPAEIGGAYLRAVPFGLVGWFLVIGFVNEGLKEVRAAKKELEQSSNTIVNTIFSGGGAPDRGAREHDEW